MIIRPKFDQLISFWSIFLLQILPPARVDHTAYAPEGACWTKSIDLKGQQQETGASMRAIREAILPLRITEFSEFLEIFSYNGDKHRRKDQK